MIKVQSARNNCKDVFHAFLVTNATYAGNLEIPELSMENAIPHKLIPFSKIFRSSSYDSWIHFYEDDVVFERLWNNPKRYLPILQRFQGVICHSSCNSGIPTVVALSRIGSKQIKFPLSLIFVLVMSVLMISAASAFLSTAPFLLAHMVA